MPCSVGGNASSFRNEIIWHHYNGTSNIRKAFVRKHDVILFHTRDTAHARYNEDAAREPYEPDSNFVKNPASYKAAYRPNPPGKRMHDVWRIPTINNMAKERTGYPTQKPLALLDRVIRASSNEGDIVFDPFCGCATTLVAAENLNRNRIGIDISEKAGDLVRSRIEQTQGFWKDITIRRDIPERNDLGKIPKYNSTENRNALYGEQGGTATDAEPIFSGRT